MSEEQPFVPFAGVICHVHGKVDIDYPEYSRQMMRPDSLWSCPKCGEPNYIYANVQFDDDRFEELNPPEDRE